ncbi:MAG: beta-1-3, beta-1-6-glucan biosynthesis protein [Xanthobacteraceae bacterium]
MRIVAASAFLLFGALDSALPQSAVPKSGETRQKPADADAQKKAAAQKHAEDFAEAARVLGGPAANPECIWLGRRVVGLIWRDDLDTAFRHLDLYDRFGCPAGHIQATFRCLVRQGNIDLKTHDTLAGRVHSCWIDPARTSKTAAPVAAPPAAAASAGTSNR